MSKTSLEESALKRFAKTQPAEPPPTIIKSYVLDFTARLSQLDDTNSDYLIQMFLSFANQFHQVLSPCALQCIRAFLHQSHHQS